MHVDTRVELFIGSKVPCVLYFEICTPEERGGEKGGSANFKTKHTEPLTQEIPCALLSEQVVAQRGHKSVENLKNISNLSDLKYDIE